MATFKNLNDLAKYLSSQKGTQAITGSNNMMIALKEAADLLYKLLHKQLQAYYDSYTPVDPGGYTRTFGLLNSLRISPITQNGNELSISVYFDQDSATHPSLFGGDAGFTPILINEGWEWNNNIGIHHLSYYEGFHFVEKAINEFNAKNKWGFKITKEGHYKGKKI
ncbi:hypothetical protein [Heyndrickxia oleronia]|jgi:hypothetical protein|uniref:hypothetical protein n=1 Tax=Heyndrickxia oleronia TaxID=38875 RepID=UPI00242B3E69|nr:hypothetical protein [Heyndrickxia oleronia]MCI1763635.1 hypothetical protein [Heyndrickxia oleronia]